MSSRQVSRRTVARGAAWSVPIVVVGVSAPAFAASTTPTASNGGSCKCPGSGGNNFNFQTAISFSTPDNDNWQLHIVSFTFDGTNVSTLPADKTLQGGEGNVILVYNVSNSQSKHTVQVVYTMTNLGTGHSFQGTYGPVELSYPPTCSAPIICPP